MYKSFFLIQIIVFISLAIYPQTTSDVVLNNWSRFKISNLNISILFPHLPIKIEGGDQCKDEKNEEYAAYQKGVVYRFNVTYEMKLGSGKLCTNHKNFDENSFTDYLKELKGNQNLTETEINGRKSFQILLANKTYWLINDYPNKRWFEFWVMGANDEKKEVTDFLASLNFNVTNTDTEINDGAEKTIGDENVENVEGKVGVTPLIIALKPRANYTDVARQNQVQGTVTLRVTFLATGSIGSVEIVNGLPDGMTEQVVKAANRMVFIPPSKDGIYYTVTKQFQYNFTLY